ncbi:MAG: beta-hydroxyacyl-ACP dehydratase [Verrucomicrobiae bacterium]|nr:beta-hydroxyacyl-ACP dehydratase [Verrucomicrobiae bacterium]MCP5542878.1 beta-hydroxyacyl-ACP dehydratase [Akkermansiaceae bacterium]MCP5547059.1 beta-hydroxyacyl-ACP dehydratase [Akkermansiaceae bacterium]
MDDSLRNALESLPHGPSFRFVDELRTLDPGREGVGIYRVAGTEEFLAGHFPGNPMMPGVILIEAVAQLGGVVAQSDPVHGPLVDLRLTAVRSAKILGAAVPGDLLEIHVRVEGRMDSLVQVSGRVTVGEMELARAVIALSGTKPKTEA